MVVKTIHNPSQTGPNVPQLQNVSGIGGRGGSGTVEKIHILREGFLQIIQQLEQGDKVGPIELFQTVSEGTESGNGIPQL